MKLSIIIPYYNGNHIDGYTAELLLQLEPQLTEDVEVIVVDDGSPEPFAMDGFPWVKVIRQDNGGVSKARNRGLDEAKGEYIAFIDADDMVSENYVKTIFSKMPFDYLEMSWKSLPGGQQFEYRLTSDNDRLRNPSSVTRVFSRATIDNVRFNEQKQAAEDAEFVRNVCKDGLKVAIVQEFLYFYRTSTPNSLTKRYSSGDTDTKRIVYHYRHITSDMTDLLEEVKHENIKNEVYVMTEQNDIPELELYAKVFRPCRVRGYELRGEPTELFSQILPPPEFDIIIYTGQKQFNGILTWIRTFCCQMYTSYNIAVLHEGIPAMWIGALLPFAFVKQNGEPIKCKTLLMMRISDDIPLNIRYEKSIQVLHSTRLYPEWSLPKDRDEIIPISKAVKESWKLTHEPIYNMTAPSMRQGIRLVSATRLNTAEKGLQRMRILVDMLHKAQIPFKWDCYSETDPNIHGITYKGIIDDVREEIRHADYLVQLSDEEGFCYSIVEALEEGTAVLTTPISVLPELGFHNKTHGYVIPFDMDFDINKIKVIPTFKYEWNNAKPKQSWGSIFGKAQTEITPPLKIIVNKGYRDMTLGRWVEEGEILTLNHRRAEEIISCGFATKMD